MDDFANAKQSNSLSVKLWRGERMCLVGMDVNGPEPDFVGFSIEVKSPGGPTSSRCATASHFPTINRSIRRFDGYRNFSSLEASFQKIALGALPLRAEGRQLSL